MVTAASVVVVALLPLPGLLKRFRPRSKVLVRDGRELLLVDEEVLGLVLLVLELLGLNLERFLRKRFRMLLVVLVSSDEEEEEEEVSVVGLVDEELQKFGGVSNLYGLCVSLHQHVIFSTYMVRGPRFRYLLYWGPTLAVYA